MRDVLGPLLDRWSLLVVEQLDAHGRTRFNGLRTAIPDVTPKALSTTLLRLQEAGLVQRWAYAESPPRVEYKLTVAGKEFASAITQLMRWAQEHGEVRAVGRTAKPRGSAAKASGQGSGS